jgi:hypothetical protein
MLPGLLETLKLCHLETLLFQTYLRMPSFVMTVL